MATGGRARGGSFRREPPRQQNRERYREREPDRRQVDRDSTQVEFGRGPTVTPGLESIGETGFFQTPPEPVDPRDCDLWPDSPYCGGSGVGSAIGLEPEVSISECEICLTITPSLAYISLPPYTICYRKPECRPRARRIDGGLLPELPRPGRFSDEIDLTGQTRACFSYNVWLTLSGEAMVTDQVTGEIIWVPVIVRSNVIERAIGPIEKIRVKRNVPNFSVSDGSFLSDQTEIECYELDPRYRAISRNIETGDFVTCNRQQNHAITNWLSLIDFLPMRGLQISLEKIVESCSDTHAYAYWAYAYNVREDPNRLNPWIVGDITTWHTRFPEFRSIHCKPWKIEFPPPPPPEPCEPCMSCCCNTPTEQEEIQRRILIDLEELKRVIAPSQFPVSMPRNLLAYEDGQQTSLPNYPQWFAWFIRQVDAVTGQFPIEVEITDIDPTKEGNQTKKIELPNIAEALAELYGLSVSTNVNADLSINFLLRMASEIIATKNATLITQDYAKANAQFLGYKGNPAKREIPYSFDPTKLDTLEGLLQNSKGNIQGWKNDDRETVVAFLQRLMFAAGIIKAAFFRNSDRIMDLREELTGMGATDDDEAVWNRFVEMMNNPDSVFNRRSGSDSAPKVRDVPGL